MKVRRNDQNGYAFWCPGCEVAHVLRSETWTFNEDIEKPTFAPSIDVKWRKPGTPSDIVCHSVVVQGTIQFLENSTHALAGKVVDLPDFPEAETTATPIGA